MSVADPKSKEERREEARLGARSLARDLLRLVRALKLKGVDLTTLDEREALDQCNQDLADALASAEEVAAVEVRIAETRALLQAIRASILGNLPRADRAEVMRAMLAVEVTEEDLAVETTPALDELDRARRRAEDRLAERKDEEERRRVAERAEIMPRIRLGKQLEMALDDEWYHCVRRVCGLDLRHPNDVADWLLDEDNLGRLLDTLHPRDLSALEMLVDADGVLPARQLERIFGDSTEDGYSWITHPPTSVLGRLRSRGLCFIGRAALGSNPRSRPRVACIPPDLLDTLELVLPTAAGATPSDPTVPADIVEQVMTDNGDDDPEGEGIRFDRAQPELASFAASVAEAVNAAPAASAVIYYVERVWAAYEAAHPEMVPRLRAVEIERARRISDRDLASLAVMHERLLRRRVATLLGTQPHLYTYLAAALEELPVNEEERAILFHSCDTTIRALDRSFS